MGLRHPSRFLWLWIKRGRRGGCFFYFAVLFWCQSQHSDAPSQQHAKQHTVKMAAMTVSMCSLAVKANVSLKTSAKARSGFACFTRFSHLSHLSHPSRVRSAAKKKQKKRRRRRKKAREMGCESEGRERGMRWRGLCTMPSRRCRSLHPLV